MRRSQRRRRRWLRKIVGRWYRTTRSPEANDRDSSRLATVGLAARSSRRIAGLDGRGPAKFRPPAGHGQRGCRAQTTRPSPPLGAERPRRDSRVARVDTWDARLGRTRSDTSVDHEPVGRDCQSKAVTSGEAPLVHFAQKFHSEAVERGLHERQRYLTAASDFLARLGRAVVPQHDVTMGFGKLTENGIHRVL